MIEQQLIEKLTQLRSLPGENEVVEFKEAKNDYDFNKIGKYFSALCNEANLQGQEYSWLIFGIEDKNKNIVGSDYRRGNRQNLDKLKGEIGNKTTNRITFIEIYELNLPNGRVVMFQIPSAPRGIPVAWDGHYYGRDGEDLCALNIEETERIRSQPARIDWSAEICTDATINDLDTLAIRKARENFGIKNSHLVKEINDWDDTTFLNKSKLLIAGRITRASVILLGKAEAEHFISPSVAQIRWILRDKDNMEKDYAHYSCPFILAVDNIFAKIRNLKYRYMSIGTLFPDEVDQYSPFSVREALNNCIAHQDYSLVGKINVIEREDGYLTFSNLGEFIPGSIEKVIRNDSPTEYYRNHFLAQAMVSLNMIDTIGSGIKRMFKLQKEKYFPLPDYNLSENKVEATITGKVLDVDYAKVLARNPDLTLEQIIMLDKVSKRKPLNDKEITELKKKELIEGRKPNFHISIDVAKKIDQKAEYIKNRGFKDQHYKDMIIEYINEYGSCSKKDIDILILEILPGILNEKQKGHKIKNLLSSMSKKDKTIINKGSRKEPRWEKVNSKSGEKIENEIFRKNERKN